MNEAKKFDEDKLQYHLIPQDALEQVVRVLMFGAEKYGANNWREGMEWTRLSDACERHLKCFMAGYDCDKETGQYHLAHGICCLLFLLSYRLTDVGVDDRSFETLEFEEKQIEE